MNNVVRIPKIKTQLPSIVKFDKGFEIVATYSRVKPSKSLWEWLEKQYDQWLDEIACWWVEKRGIATVKKKYLGVEDQFTCTTVEINLENLVKEILDYCDDYYRSSGKEIKYILVGKEQYYCLHHQLSSFMFPTELVRGNGKVVFNGCQIVLVPHMDGIVFLPDLPQPIRY